MPFILKMLPFFRMYEPRGHTAKWNQPGLKLQYIEKPAHKPQSQRT